MPAGTLSNRQAHRKRVMKHGLTVNSHATADYRGEMMGASPFKTKHNTGKKQTPGRRKHQEVLTRSMQLHEVDGKKTVPAWFGQPCFGRASYGCKTLQMLVCTTVPASCVASDAHAKILFETRNCIELGGNEWKCWTGAPGSATSVWEAFVVQQCVCYLWLVLVELDGDQRRRPKIPAGWMMLLLYRGCSHRCLQGPRCCTA